MIAFALALITALAQSEADSGRSDPRIEAPREIHPALLRDPADLPRAEANRWLEWSPRADPPVSLQSEWREATQLYRRGDLPNALGAMLSLLEREPDFPPLLHQVGVLYFKLRRYGDATVMFERYVEVAPAYVEHTRALAHALYSLGEYERARVHYLRVLEKSAADVEARRGLGLSLLRLGNAKTALEELQKVVEKHPSHADAWTWIAQIHYDAERSELALHAVNRARTADAFQPRPWFLAAQIYYDEGQDEEGDAARKRHGELDQAWQAIRLHEAQLALQPNDRPRRLALAQAHQAIGDRIRGRRVWEGLISRAPEDVDLHLTLLGEAERAEDAEAATALAARTESIAGDNAMAWKALQDFYGRNRDRAGQARAGERWLRLKTK